MCYETETKNYETETETETSPVKSIACESNTNRYVSFLQRCMECRRGLAMKILSVRPSVSVSVCLSVCQTHDL